MEKLGLNTIGKEGKFSEKLSELGAGSSAGIYIYSYLPLFSGRLRVRDFTVLKCFGVLSKTKWCGFFYWKKFSPFPVAKCLNILNLKTCSHHYDRSPWIMSCFALVFHFQAVFAQNTLILCTFVFSTIFFFLYLSKSFHCVVIRS